MVSVSYTHLDVYKRQAIYLFSASPEPISSRSIPDLSFEIRPDRYDPSVLP